MKRPKTSKANKEARHKQALSNMFKRICDLDYSPELMGWLQENYPALHSAIVEDYPIRIEDGWAKRMLIVLFESVLSDWSRLYRAAVTLFNEQAHRVPAKTTETWTKQELEI